MNKPTVEQVEEYIKCAEAELGPALLQGWPEWCSAALRAAVRRRFRVFYTVHNGGGHAVVEAESASDAEGKVGRDVLGQASGPISFRTEEIYLP